LTLETIIKWTGGLLAFSAAGILLYSIWRGTQRQAGRTSGSAGMLRSPVFYFMVSAFFFGLAWLGWIPLPMSFSPPIRTALLILGCLLYFPGLIFLLWSRLELGKNYFVSTVVGAQLFADQQLVTSGPYAIIRHPMYVGLMFAAWGALLIYATWTTVYFAVVAPFLMLRARREEQALAAEFGDQWQEYCKRIPSFIPRVGKKG
jgi:protein-S-isoprenylcysteine O-methyltransferase Ste14